MHVVSFWESLFWWTVPFGSLVVIALVAQKHKRR